MGILTAQIAKHFKDVYFGGNWTWSNYKDNLAGINWQQATTKIEPFNTIATLAYHTHYFVSAQIRVLKGEPLNAKDEYSFNHPPINTEKDWQNLLDKVWADAEEIVTLIEQMPEEKLWEDFTDKKYGNYYRNLHGCIEHLHYHLGQIAFLRKMVMK